MVTEQEFQVLKRLHAKPVLVREDDESAEEFDLVCERARDLLSRDLIHAEASNPFRKSKGLSGGRYLGAGEFDLSASAMEIIQFDSFGEFNQSLPKQSVWTLGVRLTLLGVIVAIIGLIARFL